MCECRRSQLLARMYQRIMERSSSPDERSVRKEISMDGWQNIGGFWYLVFLVGVLLRCDQRSQTHRP